MQRWLPVLRARELSRSTVLPKLNRRRKAQATLPFHLGKCAFKENAGNGVVWIEHEVQKAPVEGNIRCLHSLLLCLTTTLISTLEEPDLPVVYAACLLCQEYMLSVPCDSLETAAQEENL